MTQNLLVELFVEELPPKALKKLGESFAHSLLAALQKEGLAAAAAQVTAFATPRRLAAHITSVLAVAADKPVVQKLMPVDFATLEPGELRRSRAAQVAAAVWKSGNGYTLVSFRSVAAYVFGALSHSVQPGSEPL